MRFHNSDLENELDLKDKNWKDPKLSFIFMTWRSLTLDSPSKPYDPDLHHTLQHSDIYLMSHYINYRRYPFQHIWNPLTDLRKWNSALLIFSLCTISNSKISVLNTCCVDGILWNASQIVSFTDYKSNDRSVLVIFPNLSQKKDRVKAYYLNVPQFSYNRQDANWLRKCSNNYHSCGSIIVKPLLLVYLPGSLQILIHSISIIKIYYSVYVVVIIWKLLRYNNPSVCMN